MRRPAGSPAGWAVSRTPAPADRVAIADPLRPGALDFAADGTPLSPLYGDVFHSADGGPEQALEVFLKGSALPDRWQGRERFVILETGFGLGLNFLVTWDAWRADRRRSQRLHFVSVEKHPLRRNDLARALARYPRLAECAGLLLDQWPLPLGGMHRLRLDAERVALTLVFGDVADYARRLVLRFDALYLDGFAPAKNEAMWSVPALKSIGRLANADATVATWSVAAAVRDALAQAGFVTDKRPGFGGKRERLIGRFSARPGRGGPPRGRFDALGSPAPAMPAAVGERRAIVVGAGLAGSAVGNRLAARGWRIDLLERRAAPALAASGNPAGVFQPVLSADDNVMARLTRAGLGFAQPLWRELLAGRSERALDECGVLRVARDAGHEARQRATVCARALPEEWARYVDREAASALAGAAVAAGGWYFPTAGWIRPERVCAASIAAAPAAIQFRSFAHVARLEHRGGEWTALDANGRVLASAPVAVLACGSEITGVAGVAPMPLRSVRGQLTLIPKAALPDLRCVVAREGYVTPRVGDVHVVGATYDFDDASLEPDAAGHAGNLARLARLLPGASAGDLDPAGLAGRAAIRSVAHDRLPVVGPLPLRWAAAAEIPAPGRRDVARAPGLFGALAFGSRGLVWAALAGELLASMLEGEPLPLDRDLAAAIDPARLARRGAARREERGDVAV